MNSLTFEIHNGTQSNTIYAPTTKPDDNHLTLVIASTAETTTLTPGQLVEKATARDAKGTIFYLALSSLNLSPKELNALTCKADGWSFKVFANSDPPTLCMTPTQNITLEKGQKIEVTIENFTLAKPPAGSSAQLSMDFYRATPISSGRLSYKFHTPVTLQAPPGGKLDLHGVLSVTVDDSKVIQSLSEDTSVQNHLLLTFAPGNDHKVIEARDKTAFTVGFVYADDQYGYGALTTVERAFNFSFTAGNHATNWTITPPETGAQNPEWLLRPPAGKPILGDGVASTLSFHIGNIVTLFQAGATLMVVSYSGVPGYDDGAFHIILYKVPHVAIQSFTCSPEQSILKDGKAAVTLKWSVSNETALTLSNYGDVTHKTSQTITIDDTTQFTLTAEGERSHHLPNVDHRNVTATVLPRINSFRAAPSAVAATDFPATVWLSWNVNTKQHVTLTSSATGPDGNLYKSIGTFGKPLDGPQMLTLSPERGAAAGISRSIIVNAFQPQDSFPQLDGGGSSTAASPTASFIAVSLPSQKSIQIVSTATYHSLATVLLKGTPDRLAFSPDGATLFVACADPHAVIPVTVTPATANKPYSFSVGEAIAMPDKGKPQDLAVGSDGRVWVTVDMGDGNDGQVVAFRVCDPTQRATASVGPAPHRIALSPNGSTAYVVHRGGASVSVIVTGANGLVAGQPAPNISDPVDLTVSPDGSNLLIATRSKNLLVLKTNLLHDSTRQSYPMPGTPTAVTVFPGGSYAAVACKDKNVVALVNYSKEPKRAGPVASVDLEAAPDGVTVTPDNGLLFVGMPEVSNLGVIGLSNYIQSGKPITAPGMVTDLAPTPDGKTLFAWCDAMISVQGTTKPREPGLFRIDIVGRSLETWQKDLEVTAAVVSPAANDNRIYVATRQTSSVAVYQIDNGERLPTIPISAKDNRQNRQPINLAITADGRRLFVMTADGNLKYSVVAFQLDRTSNTSYTKMSDETVFTAKTNPLKVLMAAASDGSAVYAVDTTASKLYSLKPKPSGKEYVSIGEPLDLAAGIPSAIAILPDNSRAYVAIADASNSTNAMSIIDLAKWTVKTIYLPDSIYALQIKSLAVLPDGNKLLATDGLFAGIRLFDAASLRIVQTLSWSDVQFPCGIAIAPDGSWIATANLSSGNVAVATQVQPRQSTR